MTHLHTFSLAFRSLGLLAEHRLKQSKSSVLSCTLPTVLQSLQTFGASRSPSTVATWLDPIPLSRLSIAAYVALESDEEGVSLLEDADEFPKPNIVVVMIPTSSGLGTF